MQPTQPDKLRILASAAATIAAVYPPAAASLHKAAQALQDSRQRCSADARIDPAILEDHERQAKFQWSEQRAICEQWRQALMALATEAVDLLPGLWPRLKWVARVIDRWHDDSEFDWRPVVAELRMIEAEALRPAEKPEPAAGFVSPASLADEWAVGSEATRKALDRWRAKNAAGNGYIENTDRRPNEPAFLYSWAQVKHVLDGLKQREAKREIRRTKTSGQRPAGKIG